MGITRTVLALALAVAPAAPLAHGDAHKSGKAAAAQPVVETGFGRTGDARRVTRTLRFDMSDRMRFEPGDITVKEGETIRFLVANRGSLMHEMVIGTMKDLKEHAELMRKHPGMEHDEPYMAHVAPGKTGEIVWQFTRAGEFSYACLVAGHFEAGMIGRIKVVPR